MYLTPNIYPNNNLWYYWFCRAFFLCYSNQVIRHASLSNNSPESNDVAGDLLSAIFRRDIFNDRSSPFALPTISIVRRVFELNFNTWKTPTHLFKLNSDLGNPTNPSTCSATYYVRHGWKSANFGALSVGGDMMTQAPFPFPGRRLLLSCTEIFMYVTALNSNYCNMQNQVPASNDPAHKYPSYPTED